MKKNISSSTEIPVLKTIKLFINGEFPRTESGRSQAVQSLKSKKHLANLCVSSRKDFRNAVTAAKEALNGWELKTAYNRGQILYRMAEMMQAREKELSFVLVETQGIELRKAQLDVQKAIDALVYYAGFSDKFQQVLGAVNPVAGPHHNFTTADVMGVITLLVDQKFIFSELVAQISAIIVSGNTLVTLLPLNAAGSVLAPLAEIFATADTPKGIINLLTGELKELLPFIGSHMEVQGISCQINNQQILQDLKLMSVDNMKRIIAKVDEKKTQSLEHIMQYVEYKTIWHPIGL